MTKVNPKYNRLMLTIVIVGVVVFYSYNKYLQAQYASLYLQNGNYSVQVGMQGLYKSTQYDVVMLGNSHTYNANWNELLNRRNIANRGIVGDITTGYLQRLGYVYGMNPKICFIEGGVNDVYANYSAGQIFDNYVNIIDTIRSFDIIPVIQSTMFVAKAWPNSSEKNLEIKKLNALLSEYASKQSIIFLDINFLVSANGFLTDSLTYDGIHLNANGYSFWVSEVEKVLLKNGL